MTAGRNKPGTLSISPADLRNTIISRNPEAVKVAGSAYRVYTLKSGSVDPLDTPSAGDIGNEVAITYDNRA